MNAGSAQACQQTTSPGSGGGGSGRSEADRWAAYCSGAGPYRAGNEVSLARDQQVSGSVVLYTAGLGAHPSPPKPERVNVPASAELYRYNVGCHSANGVVVSTQILPGGAAPVSPIQIRNDVQASITIDDPAMAASPPLDDPDRFSVVRIPTWLWLDQPAEPVTATDTQAGLTVSVTATPTGIDWDMGDGTTIRCPADRQTPWRPGLPDSASNCNHTYTRPSVGQPDNAYQITATVTWDFTWTLNGAPQGVFATYDSATTTTHQVGEILSVNT